MRPIEYSDEELDSMSHAQRNRALYNMRKDVPPDAEPEAEWEPPPLRLPQREPPPQPRSTLHESKPPLPCLSAVGALLWAVMLLPVAVLVAVLIPPAAMLVVLAAVTPLTVTVVGWLDKRE